MLAVSLGAAAPAAAAAFASPAGLGAALGAGFSVALAGAAFGASLRAGRRPFQARAASMFPRRCSPQGGSLRGGLFRAEVVGEGPRLRGAFCWEGGPGREAPPLSGGGCPPISQPER